MLALEDIGFDGVGYITNFGKGNQFLCMCTVLSPVSR